MPRGLRLVAAVILTGWLSFSVSSPVLADSRSGNQQIPYLPALQPQVEFWKQVFATYSSREVMIHDTEHLERVYSVLDFRSLADAGLSDAEFEASKKAEVADEKDRIRGLLLHIHQVGGESSELSEEERRIAALFDKERGSYQFLEAAADDRIRSQSGLRERFAAGIEISRRYLPEMEAIFRREGVPVALTRLPLVESCFNVNAYSKVGAAGIWQFMPGTGRLYMRVDGAADERRDPIASTLAAAQHLKRDYEALGAWPLAITAYNHGRGGVARAVSTLNSTDLQEIVRHYKGPAFKFASRNFYAEFLAALEVEQNFEEYLGPLNPHYPLAIEYILVPDRVPFALLARSVQTPAGELAELNPALSDAVVSGRLSVPAGYSLRVPLGSSDGFEGRYAVLSAAERASQPPRRARGKTKVARGAAKASAKKKTVTHRVQPGQTLSTIAKRYGTSVQAIRRHNGLRNGSGVRSGQNLVIPKG